MLEFLSKENYQNNGFCLSKKEEDCEEELLQLNNVSEKIRFPLANTDNYMNFVRELAGNDNTKKITEFAKGTTTLGFVFEHGIILAADSRASMGYHISSQSVKKIIEINEYLLGTMAGGAADCAFWERHLSRVCALYELYNSERISVAGAATVLANIFYNYRGYGLCCGIMIAGYDFKGPQLFYIDDKGKKIIGKTFCIGSGSTYAYSILDTGYKHDLSLDDAIELAKKSIYHATYRDGGSGGSVRIYHIHKDGWDAIEHALDVFKLHKEYYPKNPSAE